MDEIMENKIKNLIMAGKFQDAKNELSTINEKTLEGILLNIGYDESNICAYAFVCFLLQRDETVNYHTLASTLMENAFCHLEGAYQVAFYHTCRAIDLCPDDIDLHETLLFFNDIPEKVITDEEAKEIAQKILQKKPTSEQARRILSQNLTQDKNK